MTNFDLQYEKAARMLERIIFLISPEYIEENIIAPLENVLFEFFEKELGEYSHQGFHRTIAEFIQAVSEKTPLYGCKLTLEKAHSEAVFLLNHFYMSLHHKGIDGATDDATNPTCNGMIPVLRIFTETLKNYTQQKHINHVEYRYIKSVNWQTRYIMTKLVLERFDVCLVPPMDKWSIEQLSGRLLDLIQNEMKI